MKQRLKDIKTQYKDGRTLTLELRISNTQFIEQNKPTPQLRTSNSSTGSTRSNTKMTIYLHYTTKQIVEQIVINK